MSGRFFERKGRLKDCQNAKKQLDRHRDKHDAHIQQKLRLDTEIANLRGEISFEESELTKILRRIQRIQTSGPTCIIGGAARKDPTACVEMLLDLSGSEAAHNANINRLNRELREKEYQMQGIERDIVYFEQMIERIITDMQKDDCYGIGIF